MSISSIGDRFMQCRLIGQQRLSDDNEKGFFIISGVF